MNRLALALLLSLGTVVSNSFGRFAYALVLPAMRNDLDWNWSQAGALNTANAVGYLVGAALTWILVDRVGNRALFCAGLPITAVAVLATGYTVDFFWLSVLRTVAGVSGAMVFICGGALASNVFPDDPRRATLAITVFFGGSGIGLILCGIAIPLILESGGDGAWPQAWFSMGVISLGMSAAAIAAARRVREPSALRARRPARRRSLSDARPAGWRPRSDPRPVGRRPRSDAGAEAASAQRAEAARPVQELAPPAREAAWPVREFIPALVGYTAFALGYIGYMTFVIAWMREHGASTTDVILVWSLLGFATLIAPWLWRVPFERWSGGKLQAAALVVLSAGAGLPLVATSLGAMLASAALFGATMFSIPAAVGTLIRQELPTPAWGAAMAVFTIVFAAGQIAGPVVTGWLADVYGSLRPGLALSVVVLLAGAAVSFAQRPREQCKGVSR